MMAGGYIILKTRSINKAKEFYTNVLGMDVIAEDDKKLVLRLGNIFLAFEQGNVSERDVRIKIFIREMGDFEDIIRRAGKYVKKVGECWAKLSDFEGREIEVECGRELTNTFFLGDTLLLTRRSIRYFDDRPVPEDILWKIFEICRYSPTSKNSQSYYFIVIKRRDILEYLAKIRGGASAPIGRAPMAVAICSDPNKSKRYIQDACIAAYHFILTAWFFGLGTCWIAAMDRDDVKEVLGIPKEHYIATITPVGYPKFVPKPPPRRQAREMVKFLD